MDSKMTLKIHHQLFTQESHNKKEVFKDFALNGEAPSSAKGQSSQNMFSVVNNFFFQSIWSVCFE